MVRVINNVPEAMSGRVDESRHRTADIQSDDQIDVSTLLRGGRERNGQEQGGNVADEVIHFLIS